MTLRTMTGKTNARFGNRPRAFPDGRPPNIEGIDASEMTLDVEAFAALLAEPEDLFSIDLKELSELPELLDRPRQVSPDEEVTPYTPPQKKQKKVQSRLRPPMAASTPTPMATLKGYFRVTVRGNGMLSPPVDVTGMKKARGRRAARALVARPVVARPVVPVVPMRVNAMSITTAQLWCPESSLEFLKHTKDWHALSIKWCYTRGSIFDTPAPALTNMALTGNVFEPNMTLEDALLLGQRKAVVSIA